MRDERSEAASRLIPYPLSLIPHPSSLISHPQRINRSCALRAVEPLRSAFKMLPTEVARSRWAYNMLHAYLDLPSSWGSRGCRSRLVSEATPQSQPSGDNAALSMLSRLCRCVIDDTTVPKHTRRCKSTCARSASRPAFGWPMPCTASDGELGEAGSG